jgi:hypothetical protein
MGAPSQEQIDEAIAAGIAEGLSEEETLMALMALERLSDEELAAYGIDVRAAPPVPALSNAHPAPSVDVPDFVPAPIRTRHDGWTAARQRAFIEVLTETGCVSEACAEVGISARSAYRLREHPKAAGFRIAWDHALSLSTARLSALAFERAVHGTVEQLFHKGELVGERRRPDNRLLMWLLAHHDPVTYGYLSKPQREAPHQSFYMTRAARSEMPELAETLQDVPFDECPVDYVGIRHPDYDDSLHARA